MKFLLAILALLLVEVAFSDKASTTPDEKLDATSQEDDAKKWNSEANSAPALKLGRPRLACRPMRSSRVKAILKNKAKAFRSLGVRLVKVPRRLQSKLRRFKKITFRRLARHRGRRPSYEMCQERPAPVKLTSANYANADVAYRTQGIECAEYFCNVRIGARMSLTLSGGCALRSTRVVVPVFDGCRFVSKTIYIGCSCKCRIRNPIG